MSLLELIASVEAHERTLTVFNADDGVVEALRERFADRNLSVVGATAAAGPRSYAVLSDDDEFVTAVNVADVLVDESTRSVGFDGSTYRPVLDNLDETMFTSYDVGQMVSASREIEDRAWRAGRGSLHAGFQTVTTLASQRESYERLGSRDGLDVHAYAFPDRMPDEELPFSLHLERAEELERAWFVAYDGGGVDENKCALVAEERHPRRFYGFWTYDPSTVDYVVDYLTHTYALAETDGGSRGASA